jgi:ADP-glucose pyrophosphorylase
MKGFVAEAVFWDIGTVSDYWKTSRSFAQGVSEPRYGRSVLVDPGAEVIDSVLWDNVTIGAGASVRECIVTDGVSVPNGVTYTRSILRVEDGALRVDPFHLE